MNRCTGLLLLCACAGGDQQGEDPFDVALGTPEVWVSLESGLIGHPTDLALDHTGRLWIADSRSHRILVVEPDGAVAFMIDREGDGPGELRRPAVLEVLGTTVRVLDSGTMRVQDYSLAGEHIGDRPFAAPMLGAAALSGDRIAMPTLGQESVLAEVRTLGDSARVLLGPSVTPPPAGFDLTALKAEIADGRVPDALRNGAMPVAGSDGVTWVLVQAEAEVRRYGPDGVIEWSRVLDAPEVEQARREFFRTNAELLQPNAISFLNMFAAGAEVAGDIWVMMAGEQDSPAALYVLDRDSGAVIGRMTVPTPAPPNGFVVDRARDRLYMSIPDEASILAVGLPFEVTRLYRTGEHAETN